MDKTTEITPACNSTYPKVAVQWLNQAWCIYQSFCLVDSEVLRNRHLRVAAKRYSQYYPTESTRKHFAFVVLIVNFAL